MIRAGAWMSYGWKTPRIAAFTLSSRRGEQNDLGDLKMSRHCESGASRLGRQQGCQRYGSTEVWGRITPRMNPSEPTEADQAS